MEVGRFDAQPSEGDLNVRKLFAAAGSLVMKAVLYCEVGYQATFVYMLARYLGFGSAMYDGSHNKWRV